jgi:hypothetical protein
MTTKPTQPVTIGAFTVDAFAAAHGISRQFLYKLWRGEVAGDNGPTYRQVGGRRLISTESAAAWRNGEAA